LEGEARAKLGDEAAAASRNARLLGLAARFAEARAMDEEVPRSTLVEDLIAIGDGAFALAERIQGIMAVLDG
jgi:hypothetical protein